MSCDPVTPPQEAVYPPPIPPPYGTTILVTDPRVTATVTDLEEVDAVGAMRRGLQEYLARASKDVAGVRVRFEDVLSEWADAEDDDVRYPSAVVLAPATIALDDFAFSPVIKGVQTPTGRYLSKHAEASTDFTVEVHCASPGERSAVLLMLEEALHPVDWMYGFHLELPFYFGQRASFAPQSLDLPDDAAAARHNLRLISVVLSGRISVVRPRTLPLAQIKRVVQVVQGGKPFTP